MATTKALLEQHKTLTGILVDTVVVPYEGGPTPLVISTPQALPEAQVGEPYNFALTATGGTPPYTWTISLEMLPPGLSVSTGGVISGIPTDDGSYTGTINISDDNFQSTSKTFLLTVQPEEVVEIPTEFTYHAIKRRVAGAFQLMALKRRVAGEWITVYLKKYHFVTDPEGVYVDIYSDSYSGTLNDFSDTYTDTYV